LGKGLGGLLGCGLGELNIGGGGMGPISETGMGGSGNSHNINGGCPPV